MTHVHVVKRNGSKAGFDKERIYSAIEKAAAVTDEFTDAETRKITETVVYYIFESKAVLRDHLGRRYPRSR